MDWYTSMLNFVHTVDAGSLAEAARELGVVPSAISKSISRLEKCIGVQLLDRTTRRLAPTEAGQVFYIEARQAVNTTQHAFQVLRSLRRSKPLSNDPTR